MHKNKFSALSLEMKNRCKSDNLFISVMINPSKKYRVNLADKRNPTLSRKVSSGASGVIKSAVCDSFAGIETKERRNADNSERERFSRTSRVASFLRRGRDSRRRSAERRQLRVSCDCPKRTRCTVMNKDG